MITSPDAPLEVMEARKLGQDCAIEADHAAGPTPWDENGISLLPQKPQEGDWQALEELHPAETPREEREEFLNEYQRVIRKRRGLRFGQYVRSARLSLDLLQQELADMIGVTNNTISRWERAEVIPERHTESGVIRQLRKFQREAGKTF